MPLATPLCENITVIKVFAHDVETEPDNVARIFGEHFDHAMTSDRRFLRTFINSWIQQKEAGFIIDGESLGYR